jgi:hypothetical protein
MWYSSYKFPGCAHVLHCAAAPITSSVVYRYVHSSKTCNSSLENPQAAHETPFHRVKTGAWCAVFCGRNVGNIFFESGINSELHIVMGKGLDAGFRTSLGFLDAWYS